MQDLCLDKLNIHLHFKSDLTDTLINLMHKLLVVLMLVRHKLFPRKKASTALIIILSVLLNTPKM